MANSPNARHQSRLAREMARDLNRHDYSVASSTGSHHGTISDDSMDFDPENPDNDVAFSTQRMDYDISGKLPQLRDTAKKYGRWSGGSAQQNTTQDFYLNTSAIGRAFPDFSQSGDTDDSQFSIEQGRGIKTQKRVSSARTARAEFDDHVNSPPVNMKDFQIMGTPPISKRTARQEPIRGSIKAKKTGTPLKENIPTAGGSVRKNYISGASVTASGGQRRTLAELQAKVADDFEGSFISDERPTVTFPTKTKVKGSPLNPERRPTLGETLSARRAENARQAHFNGEAQTPTPSSRIFNANPTMQSSVNQTQHSFLLPNMPDLSSLVSGSFKDGTPVFSKNKTSKSFNAKGPSKPSHYPVEQVPIPDEEREIFSSLQIAQERAAKLEHEKADLQRQILELQEQNYALEVENNDNKRRRGADSALGDSASEGEKKVKEKSSESTDKDMDLTPRIFNSAANVISELEAQIMNLQKANDEYARTVKNYELQVKNITVEREQAVRQLAEAYRVHEELQNEVEELEQENKLYKKENSKVEKENGQLKLQLARLNTDYEEDTKQFKRKETELKKAAKSGSLEKATKAENNELKDKLKRINDDFAMVQQQLASLNSELNREKTLRIELQDNTLNFTRKEKELLDRLSNEMIKRSEAENQSRGAVNAEREVRELKRELKRKERAVEVLREVTLEFKKANAGMPSPTKTIQSSKSRKSTGIVKESRGREKTASEMKRELARQRSASRGQGQSRVVSGGKSANFKLDLESFEIQPTAKNATKTAFDDEISEEGSEDEQVDESYDSNVSDDHVREDTTTKTIHKDINVTRRSEDTHDSNFSDILGHGELAAMREAVAFAKFRRAELEAGRTDPGFRVEMTGARVDDTMQSVRSNRSIRSSRSMTDMRTKTRDATQTMPVGILKNGNTITNRVIVEMDDTDGLSVRTSPIDANANVTIQEEDDNTRISSNSRRSHGRRHSEPFVRPTAAFGPRFDPASTDSITLDLAALSLKDVEKKPLLSEKAKEVLNELCKHDGKNCTVCVRVSGFSSAKKNEVTVPMPVPVSDRMPAAKIVDGAVEEPTMRPSVAPYIALSRVLKTLQDELTHLRMLYTNTSLLYTSLDVSLGMRERRRVKADLDRLGKTCEEKGDVVYNLYDVLEGLKQAGLVEEVTMEMAENTLNDLGIQIERVGGGANGGEKKGKGRQAMVEDAESESDGEWEGIEDSSVRMNISAARRRSGVQA